ncbi:MAG: 30S ribosomal protein S9 [bacterium]|nr:30S ribosomal protein S9 [bacterium]
MTTEIKTQDKAIGKYITATGRRKTSVAQVRLFKNVKGTISVNDLNYTEYFSTKELQSKVTRPLKAVGMEQSLGFSIVVKGGGKVGQADAICHGISRALLEMDKDLKPTLRAEDLLTRDARKKERKKPGLKKARRAPQWSKR